MYPAHIILSPICGQQSHMRTCTTYPLHICAHIYTYTCTHIHTNKQTNIRTYMHSYIHTHTHTHTHTPTHTHTHSLSLNVAIDLLRLLALHHEGVKCFFRSYPLVGIHARLFVGCRCACWWVMRWCVFSTLHLRARTHPAHRSGHTHMDPPHGRRTSPPSWSS
jgi:hypothetical protein